MSEFVSRVTRHRLFWPVAALVALISINAIAQPRFMKITIRDGQMYGALIDIMRNSAPLMLVALGMTIVIATRGIDLSVGAIIAVSGAVALTIIDGSDTPDAVPTVLIAVGDSNVPATDVGESVFVLGLTQPLAMMKSVGFDGSLNRITSNAAEFADPALIVR